MRTKLIMLISLIFVLSIIVQLYYLTEYFTQDIFIIDNRIIPVSSGFKSLFSNTENNLVDIYGTSIYSKLLSADYTDIDALLDQYSDNLLIDHLSNLEKEINGDSGINLVYIIGARSGQTSPNSPGSSNQDTWFNLAGEYLKLIGNTIYVYSGLIQVKSVHELETKNYYIEGWVRLDVRSSTSSNPKKSDILTFVENETLCMETVTTNSKLYDLSNLKNRFDTEKSKGYNGTNKAFYKITYKGEVLKEYSNWTNGIKNGLRGELKSRITNVYKDDKKVYDLTYPYCDDYTKLHIQGVSGIDITYLDIFFGSAEKKDGDMEQPLPEIYVPVRELKEIDFTIPINMSERCARLARTLIKRENGNLLQLRQDIGGSLCEIDELTKTLQDNLVTLGEVIMKPRVQYTPPDSQIITSVNDFHNTISNHIIQHPMPEPEPIVMPKITWKKLEKKAKKSAKSKSRREKRSKKRNKKNKNSMKFFK